ncbi:DUF3221 domain-containing protein [Filobacillus milosensis]|uniref:DUF3221 domain-containing protein n=1 Tax=Filobacillus milosensis TaxID=94137 RepID=UPI001890E9D9|nr:DUF3221 domain-containing protein [Filobacillus milosensis]
MALFFIVSFSVACTSGDDHKSKDLDTLEGTIVDKRETEDYQILVVPNKKKDDTEIKPKNDKAWYSISSKTYSSLEEGDQVRVYYNPNGVLESQPPQFVAEGVEVIVD